MTFTASAHDDSLTAPDPRRAPLPRAELLQLYTLAVDEYRFNVRLGAQRQTLYVAAAVGASLVGGALRFAPAYAIGILASLAGAFVAHRSHRHYVAAREHFRRVERELGLRDRGLGLSTTPGMRGAGGRISITRAVIALLVALAALDIVGAVRTGL